MMTIKELQEKLETMNLTAVSAASGVGYAQVYRISKGIENVTYSAVKNLSNYFEGKKDAEA
jgi:predicted transcriptional regulator